FANHGQRLLPGPGRSTGLNKAALHSLFELKDATSSPSVDLHFCPSPPAGQEARWIKTTAGKGWFIYLRIYGRERTAVDKSWRPGDSNRSSRLAARSSEEITSAQAQKRRGPLVGFRDDAAVGRLGDRGNVPQCMARPCVARQNDERANVRAA